MDSDWWIKSAMEILPELEWVQNEDTDFSWCPVCEGISGHEDSCWLRAALLGKYRPNAEFLYGLFKYIDTNFNRCPVCLMFDGHRELDKYEWCTLDTLLRSYRNVVA